MKNFHYQNNGKSRRSLAQWITLNPLGSLSRELSLGWGSLPFNLDTTGEIEESQCKNGIGDVLSTCRRKMKVKGTHRRIWSWLADDKDKTLMPLESVNAPPNPRRVWKLAFRRSQKWVLSTTFPSSAINQTRQGLALFHPVRFLKRWEHYRVYCEFPIQYHIVEIGWEI